MRTREALWDAALDLVTGSTCVLCHAPGRALCRRCNRDLPLAAAPAWPTPTPPGLVLPCAAGAYEGSLRTLVIAHKEQGRLALARPLGELLAAAVREVGARRGYPGTLPAVRLVPVPSSRRVVRTRGHDPLLRMSREAAVALRRGGVRAGVLPLLRSCGRAQDQAGLTASERAANLDGRFRARAAALPGPLPGPPVVLVDDVVTTGATLREAQRALEKHGVFPLGAATVAATRRRRPPRGG